MLSTGLWQYTNMSTTPKAPDRLKNSECKRGQLSNRPPILYVADTDIMNHDVQGGTSSLEGQASQ
jgi:hypothetical protein